MIPASGPARSAAGPVAAGPVADPAVAAALEPLATAADQGPAEQVVSYTAIHLALQAALDAKAP